MTGVLLLNASAVPEATSPALVASKGVVTYKYIRSEESFGGDLQEMRTC